MSRRDGGAHAERRSGRSVARIIAQSLAFLVGVGLLWWCARQALAEENRAQIERLSEASVLDVGLLAVLCLATVGINGLIFWATIRPVHRLSWAGVQATNALATFLNYLPFKLSVLARVLIHNRRDGVPVLTIGAWFGAVAVVMLAVYLPLIGVSLWRGSIDAAWVLAGGAGLVVGLGAVWGASRVLAGQGMRARLVRAATRAMPRLGPRLAGSPALGRVLAGLDMLASPGALAGVAALRLADIGVQALRFVVAAGVLGVAMSAQDALLVASTYFLIGVASPAGQLGTREAGTRWLAGLLGLAGGEDLAVVMLLVSAIESLVCLVAAGGALLWLRPGSWLWAGRRAGAAQDRAGPPPEHAASAPPE